MSSNQINLSVPYYCQRDNTYVWRYRYEEDINYSYIKKETLDILIDFERE